MKRLAMLFACVLCASAQDVRTLSDWRWIDSSATFADDAWGGWNASGSNVTVTASGWLMATSRWAIAGGNIGSATTWTVEAWFTKTNVNAAASFAECIYSEGLTTNNAPLIQIGVFAGTNVFFEIRDSGNTDRLGIYTGRGVSDGQRHHVAATKNGTNMFLYLDSRLVLTTNMSGTLALNTRRIGSLARIADTNLFAGTIHRVRISDTALSAAEIAERSSGGILRP